MSKRTKVREYLRDYLMSYTFVKDDFYPNPEFKKNKNILWSWMKDMMKDQIGLPYGTTFYLQGLSSLMLCNIKT